MSNKKIEVFAIFDITHNTWNVMKNENECLFYGCIDEMEEWLYINQELYQEVNNLSNIQVA